MLVDYLRSLGFGKPDKSVSCADVPARSSLTGVWAMLAILAAAFVLMYLDTFASLIREWSARDDYSHGFLIPFISLYFAWSDRQRFKQIQVQPHIPGGLAVLIIGVLTLVLGKVGGIIAAQQFSLLIILPGLVLLLTGARFLRALALPLGYLVLMIPTALDAAIGWTHWPFQLFTAKTASILFAFVNIPVYQHAQYLELPNGILEVANACSGVRYLVSIVAIGIPLAVLTQKTVARRILLIALALLIGIIANPIRVTLIGIWSYSAGEITHGPLHIFQGLFVSMVGVISLFLFARILSRLPSAAHSASPSSKAKRQFDQNEMSVEKNNPGIEVGTYRGQMKRFRTAWLASLAVFVAAGLFLIMYKPAPVPLGKDLHDFPVAIGQWRTVSEGNDNGIPLPPGADSVLTRTYRNDQGKELNLYIGYFAFQIRDKQLVHWNMRKIYDNRQEITVPVMSGSTVRVNGTALQGGVKQIRVLYWYYLDGKIVASPYRAKIMTAVNLLFLNKSNGAIVIISGNVKGDRNADILLSDEVEFARNLFSALSLYFLENKDIGGAYVL